MELGVEDTLAFRLNQFNLGAPLQWFREICNMSDVTHTKLQKVESQSGWMERETNTSRIVSIDL